MYVRGKISLYCLVGWVIRGFSRFVNIRDGTGATPLHLAARQSNPDCVRALLSSGALVSASTGGYRYHIA